MDQLILSLEGHAQWIRNYRASPTTYIEPTITPEILENAAFELKRRQDEISDLNALIEMYRRWASQCPILEKNPR